MLHLRRSGCPRRLVALALDLGRLLLIGRRRFQAVLLDRRVAEHQHRARHVAELVATLGAGHLDVVLALGQRRHGVDQLPDRPRDREHHKPDHGPGDRPTARARSPASSRSPNSLPPQWRFTVAVKSLVSRFPALPGCPCTWWRCRTIAGRTRQPILLSKGDSAGQLPHPHHSSCTGPASALATKSTCAVVA